MPRYRERGIYGQLTFTYGLQILAAVSDPGNPIRELLPRLGNLRDDRNRCEYEHGLVPQVPSGRRVERHLETVRSLVAPAFGGDEALTRMLEGFRYPVIGR